MNIATPSRPLVLSVGIVAPLAVSAVLLPLRDTIENTNVALILVLVVVAIAASGLRWAGAICAISSALWFDFFWTQPYQQFTITDQADTETTVLLVALGIAVTEIALWGRRQQAGASRREGYLKGVLDAAAAVASGQSPPVLVDHVARQLIDLLNLDACRFDGSSGGEHPRLNPDGTVTAGGRQVDVVRVGLPTEDEIELPIQYAGRPYGRYLLTASTRVIRPDLERRQVAVALADQVGAALAQ
jgi:hypothetical protein